VLDPRGISPAYLTGQQNDIESFKADKTVLLMSGAGAYGVNLQDQAHIMILIDKPFNPAVLEQVKARIDRIGQKFPVQYHEFNLDSKIERRAYEIVERKNITSNKLISSGDIRMKNKTVEDLLTEALKAMGADGLCTVNGECGCGLDDLAPCRAPYACCVAAKRVEVSKMMIDTLKNTVGHSSLMGEP